MISPGVCDLGPVKLHYLQAGVGDLVLCLHGFPDHAPSMRALLEELAAAGFRAVAPFMRGYAPSTTEARTFESAALAGDVLGLGASLASGPTSRWSATTGARPPPCTRPSCSPSGSAAWSRSGCRTRAFARALREDPAQQRRFWYGFFFLAEGFAERAVADRDFAFLERLIADWSPRTPFTPEEWFALRRTLSSRGTLTAAMRYYRSALGAEPRDPVLARDAARWDEPVRVPTLAIYGGARRVHRPGGARLPGRALPGRPAAEAGVRGRALAPPRGPPPGAPGDRVLPPLLSAGGRRPRPRAGGYPPPPRPFDATPST